MVEKSKSVNLLSWLTSKVSNVAMTGDYNDLTNKPTIPSTSTLLNLSVVYEDGTTTIIPLLIATSTSVNES